MKYGMNLLLWTGHVTSKQFPLFEKLKKVGYDGVEIPVFEGDEKHYASIKKELDKQGLKSTTVTVMNEQANPISPDAKIRKAAVERLKRTIDLSNALGAEILAGPVHSALGVFSGSGPTADEKKRAADVLREAGEYIGNKGKIKIAIEYLIRFECYLLNTARDTAAMVKSIDHPAVQMMYDTFHANLEEKDGPRALAEAGKHVIHIHISENDRGTPGTGHIQWAETFAQIKKMKYEGWLTIESFGRLLPDLAAATKIWRDLFPSPEEVYTEGFKFMKKMSGNS